MIGLYFEIIGSVLSILVVISLLSCAQVKKNDTEQYQTATSEENRIQSEVNGLLAKGDIQGVLDICKKSYSRYQTKGIFTDRYIKTIETIKNLADKAFEAHELPQAEKIYVILLKNFNDFQSFSDLLSFTKGFLNARITNCRASIARKEVQQALSAGRFQKVIDTYRNLCAKYPKNRMVLVDYVKALKDMHSTADKAIAMNDYAVAWKSYAVLLKNFSYFEGFAKQLSFNRESLHESIGECRSLLFTKGLNEYRNGHLQDAISTWQCLLVFAPDDKDTKHALDTAVAQMKGIQQKR
ncbi:MAG: hypothetical protein ACLPN1_15900 [Dissulfurispiraceae bacterium]